VSLLVYINKSFPIIIEVLFLRKASSSADTNSLPESSKNSLIEEYSEQEFIKFSVKISSIGLHCAVWLSAA
jgi:hypothetical protein